MECISSGFAHNLALISGMDIVLAWGWNVSGQLGNLNLGFSETPILATNLTRVVAVSAGTFHSLALRQDGTVWSWGDNNVGQLGNGTPGASAEAVQVAKIEGAIAIAAGGYHSLALAKDGTVWAWGLNDNGQLGDGSVQMRPAPRKVREGTRILKNVVSIAAGAQHSLAVLENGRVMAWGMNDEGQLGDRTTTDRRRPVFVYGLTGVEF